ncbi:hypothetical protein CRG98_020442 [Punica granatum]|uniref:Protein NRT1/ PTR FAMILY 4.2-like n=1 Tax=Punica granatum TaxID=22663 RepID=A0A2I0JS87_PUNGR|nr:hypothetical protein CRG98_020442 [Punica granatum]
MDTKVSIERAEFVDWRGKRASAKKHGGVRAAAFTCAVEVMENLVFLSNATNFISYFTHSMHYPIAEAANMTTNFMGTAFLFPLFGGFIGDAFLTRFKTFVLFCSLELLGLILLTIQAHEPGLQPSGTKTPNRSQAAILYAGLYAMAIGVGGVKAALPAHGADQIEQSDQRAISAFFNCFRISLVVLGLGLLVFVGAFPIYRYKLPSGSAFTRIYTVFASAFQNWKVSPTQVANNYSFVGMNSLRTDGKSNDKFKFLDKALVDNKISASDVEETKTFIGLLPIFASTIMMSCCLAQLQTFTVQQGAIMNRDIRGFKIPTQSLSVFPLFFMLASIPLYEHSVHLFGAKSLSMFQPLRRIGIGLALASASMAAAALVESRRRAEQLSGTTISVFWLVWQYMLLGVSDMFTLGGMLEFFYSEAPDKMRSMCTALSWCSTSMGYFLSSVLVSVTNSASGRTGKKWLGGNDLNHNRADLYYTLLCILNFINLLNYIYWAKKF